MVGPVPVWTGSDVMLPDLPEPAATAHGPVLQLSAKAWPAGARDLHWTEDMIEFARRAVLEERQRCIAICEELAKRTQKQGAQACVFALRDYPGAPPYWRGQ